jgi:outer membrane protein TolC
LASVSAAAEPPRPDVEPGLPDPVTLEYVITFAAGNRQEIVAARARAQAAGERPAIVSALEDPMLMPAIDHLPFMLHGLDASLMVEQRFPLSRVRGHRRRAAEADAERLRAEAERVRQDVMLDAARAFLMLRERRQMDVVLESQLSLARQFKSAAQARYRAGPGTQPDVLRAEMEVARLEGAKRAIGAEIAAAEAMLNASLGRSPEAPVPRLAGSPAAIEPRSLQAVRALTLQSRPELKAGHAEVSRAGAEVSVMKSMYAPMGLIQTGPAYTMADKWGWMVTFGISIPLWRGKLGAGVREAEAMRKMARADLSAMTLMAEGEAISARQEVIAARQRLLALREDVLPRARQVVTPSLAAYAAGTLPLVSVLDAAQALWGVEAELISAEFELGLAWARLYRAQGFFQPPAPEPEP